jgi:hypothetical protein
VILDCKLFHKLFHGSVIAQETCGQESQRAQEIENRVHGNANQSKWQNQQPYKWIQHEG